MLHSFSLPIRGKLSNTNNEYFRQLYVSFSHTKTDNLNKDFIFPPESGIWPAWSCFDTAHLITADRIVMESMYFPFSALAVNQDVNCWSDVNLCMWCQSSWKLLETLVRMPVSFYRSIVCRSRLKFIKPNFKVPPPLLLPHKKNHNSEHNVALSAMLVEALDVIVRVQFCASVL